MQRLVAALTALVGLAGIVFVAAYLTLGAGSDQAARLAPADTAAYVTVYLQPSSGQRQNLDALAGRLPGFADAASLDEKIDQVAQNLFGQAGVDYREQVRPWLGGQLAVAVRPPEEAATAPVPPAVVVLVAVKDRVAAEAAVDEIASQRGDTVTTETYQGVELNVAGDAAYAFVGEMLVAGDSADSLRAVVDVERGAPSLADAAEFRGAMDALPPDHVAAAYLDLARLAGAGGAAAQLGGFSVASAALIIEEGGLRLVGSAPFDAEAAGEEGRAAFALASEASSLVEWMPADTRAELVVFGARQLIEAAEGAAGETAEGAALVDALSSLRTLAAFGLGIDLDADVLPLLDGETAIAFASLDGDQLHGQLLLRPTDPAAAAELMGRLTDRLEAAGASVTTQDGGGIAEITVLDVAQLGKLAYAVADGIVILGLDAADVSASLAAHESGETLAGSDRYRGTFELAGTHGGNELYVDIGALVDQIGAADALPADVRDILREIGTFGLSAPSREDHVELNAVLTVD